MVFGIHFARRRNAKGWSDCVSKISMSISTKRRNSEGLNWEVVWSRKHCNPTRTRSLGRWVTKCSLATAEGSIPKAVATVEWCSRVSVQESMSGWALPSIENTTTLLMSSETKDELDVPVEDVDEEDVDGPVAVLVATGRRAMNHVASSGFSSGALVTGWSPSGSGSLVCGSQAWACRCRRCRRSRATRFCSASCGVNRDGTRICRPSPWNVAMTCCGSWIWCPMWIAQGPAPSCCRCVHTWSTSASWRALAGWSRNSTECALSRKRVSGSMMWTVEMRHADLVASKCWWTITVAAVPRNAAWGGSGLMKIKSTGEDGSTRSSHMKRTSLSHSMNSMSKRNTLGWSWNRWWAWLI